LVAENVISTDKSALLWMYCREIARGKVEDLRTAAIAGR